MLGNLKAEALRSSDYLLTAALDDESDAGKSCYETASLEGLEGVMNRSSS